MKKLVLTFFLVCSAFFVSANILSNSAKIHLLTCQPGTEVYATFGHSALYVQDKENNIDAVFNYGIFDFDEDDFLYKFIKGETYYILGVSEYEDFLWSYERRQCGVYSQELNLTQDEKERLFAALYENAKPENRRYLYNFFYDNCATRIRDIVEKSVDGKVLFPSFDSDDVCYRTYVAEYATNNTWLKFGIDVLVGQPADVPISDYEAMFLPDYLSNNFKETRVVRDSTVQSLVAFESENLVPDFPREKPTRNAPLLTMFGVLLIAILISIYEIRKKRQIICFDFILFFVAGLIGIVVTFVQFFSIHPAVFPNYNILWLHPLQLVFAVLLLIKPIRNKLRFYHYFNIIMVLAAIIFSFFAQKFHLAFYPLLAVMILRSVLGLSKR